MDYVRKFFGVKLAGIALLILAFLFSFYYDSFSGGLLEPIMGIIGFILPHPDDNIWFAFAKTIVILSIVYESL